MSFSKNYPNRKDKRCKYYKSKAWDASCRPGGSCPYCYRSRMHKHVKRAIIAQEKIKEFLG